jgi:excisionase family DNA binding protein
MNPNSSPTPWRDYAYLTRKTAAKYLRVNPYTLYKHREEIPFLKAGRHYLYEKKELDRLVRPCPRGGKFTDIFPWGLGDDRTYLTRREAAKHLGRSVSLLAQYPKRIPAYKFFGTVLYIKEELDLIMGLERIILKSKEDES